MLEGLRTFLLGAPMPPSGQDAIPQRAREASHRLRNTAMVMKQVSREIDREANDLLELLTRDIKQNGGPHAE